MLSYQLYVKLDQALAILSMIPEFERMGRPYSAQAAIDQLREMFLHVPDLYLFDSQASEDKRCKKNENRLRELLFQLQGAAAKEGSFLHSKLKNELTARYCLVDTHARISLMLHENAPLARANEDNSLVDMDIPLSYLGIGEKYLTEAHSHPEAFSDYVLNESCPRLSTERLKYIAAIWLDFDVSFHIGRTLNDSSMQLNRDELGQLLSWPQIALGNELDLRAAESSQPEESWLGTLEQLIPCIKRLQGAVAHELPEGLLKMHFTTFLDCLKSAWRDIRSSHHGRIRKQHQATPNHDYIKNVERLDQTIRLFEPEARSLIGCANHLARAAGPQTGLFMRESNPAEIANCTLWTRRNSVFSGNFSALPLISIPYVSGAIIGDAENWSETSAISSMRYLTHVFAHDSWLPWSDLGYADYITIRVDCSRQLYRNFSDGI